MKRFLKRLLHRSEDGSSRADWMRQRARFLQGSGRSQYHARYENLRNSYADNKHNALKTHSLPYDFARVKRWYDLSDKALRDGLDSFDAALCDAVRAYFMREYDRALCRFHDALEACRTDELKPWLLVKMAACFSFSDKEAARVLSGQAYAAKDGGVCAYIDQHLAATLRKSGEAPIPASGGQKNKVRVEEYTGAFQIDPARLHAQVDSVMEIIARRRENGVRG